MIAAKRDMHQGISLKREPVRLDQQVYVIFREAEEVLVDSRMAVQIDPVMGAGFIENPWRNEGGCRDGRWCG